MLKIGIESKESCEYYYGSDCTWANVWKEGEVISKLYYYLSYGQAKFSMSSLVNQFLSLLSRHIENRSTRLRCYSWIYVVYMQVAFVSWVGVVAYIVLFKTIFIQKWEWWFFWLRQNYVKKIMYYAELHYLFYV